MHIGFRAKWNLIVVIACLLPVGLLFLAGCNDNGVGPARPGDTTAPLSRVLRLDSVTAGQVKLSWRAPGDDNVLGFVSGYDLRYSEDPLDETSWSSATSGLGTMSPGPPESMERATISDLTPGQTYYFALKSHDEVPNWSDMSPVILITIPLDNESPVPWNGRLVTESGTSMSSFVFHLYQIVTDHSDNNQPHIVIDDIPYPMYNIPHSQDDINTLWGYTTRLATGSHDYYFMITAPNGKKGRLPSSDAWQIPSVVDVESTILDCVDIQPGTFAMGNSNPYATQVERPQHEVVLTEPIKMSRYEITNSQLCEVLNWAYQQELLTIEGDTVVYMIDPVQWIVKAAPHRSDSPQGIQFSQLDGFTPMPFCENKPATYVTWYGAVFYCNTLSLIDGLEPAYVHDGDYWRSSNFPFSLYNTEGWRLPTESEWEYVAQFNDGRPYPTGSGTPRAGIEGNFGNILGRSSDVGQYPQGANLLGIHDLSGNVWEWCHDWSGSYRSGSQTSPLGHDPIGAIARIVRGGSWGSDIDELRCIQRFSQRPRYGIDGLGFRMVRSVSEAP